MVEIIEETKVEEQETIEPEQSEDREEETQDPEPAEKPEENEQEDSFQISFDGEKKSDSEQEDQPAPQWVKELRRRHTEMKKENRELRDKLKKIENPVPASIEPGPKPTLEGCDYDSTIFDQKLSDWYESKKRQELEVEKLKRAQEKANIKWQHRLNTYNEKKTALPVVDFDDAELSVQEQFNQTQQGIIVSGCDDAALVVYALGKNPAKAKELSQIDDPIDFAFAVARLEKDMRVGKKKKTSKPEPKIKSTGKPSGAVDSTLERLREDAARTGDMSKVIQYKRQKRSKK